MGIVHTISTLIILSGCSGVSTDESNQIEAQLIANLGKWKQFDQTISQITDVQQKDIILLKLAVKEPKFGPALCQRTRTENAKEKCRQVVGRPHLRNAK